MKNYVFNLTQIFIYNTYATNTFNQNGPFLKVMIVKYPSSVIELAANI